MRGMGYRTIKTAIGAGLAIWLSTLFQLQFATFSAIIVIMCIEKTKKKTLLVMKEKFLASILAVLFGMFFFELLGYHPIVFSLYILLFVPLLIRIHLQAGFVTAMVVVLHVYTVEKASWSLLLNEFYIICIGMGIALTVNSFMPSFKKDIKKFKKEIEDHFSTILFEFSAKLKDRHRSWDEKELLNVEKIINEAKSVAMVDVENHLLRKENLDYYYLDMRENQLELLKRIVKIIHIISTTELPIKQKEMLAKFLEQLSERVHSGNTTEDSLKELENLKEAMSKTELPKVREEFVVRANLIYLIYEMENYLKIKRKVFAENH